MRQRLISAAVLVPVVVILFVLGPPWLTLAIAVLAALCAYETAQLVRAAGIGASRWIAVSWAALAVLGLAWFVGPVPLAYGWALVGPLFALLVIVAAVAAFRQPHPRDGFRAWLGTVFAGLFPAMLGFAAALVGIAPGPQDVVFFGYPLDNGRTWLLVLVLTVWTLDSAAYVVGRFFGRGRFMNHISPNKTWSGAIGGTVAAMAVCTLLFAGSGQSQIGGLLLGFVIAVTAQAGDLAESMIKRAAGAKDSGRLIPGHGGFLDRVDSFMFAAPVLAGYALLAAGRVA